jgi:hypothetical protein
MNDVVYSVADFLDNCLGVSWGYWLFIRSCSSLHHGCIQIPDSYPQQYRGITLVIIVRVLRQNVASHNVRLCHLT